MAETALQKQALALANGARELLDHVAGPYGLGLRAEDLIPARELLTMAILTLSGTDEAREKKREADRARRAKAKTKPRAPRRKRPRPSKTKAAVLEPLS